MTLSSSTSRAARWAAHWTSRTHRLIAGCFKRSQASEPSSTSLSQRRLFRSGRQADSCFGTTHADYFYGEVPVTRPMTPEEIQSAYEWETGNVIVERFQNLDPTQVSAVLVTATAFAWGPSGAKAVENALALEIVAEMARKARRSILPPSPFHKPFSTNTSCANTARRLLRSIVRRAYIATTSTRRFFARPDSSVFGRSERPCRPTGTTA